MEIKFFYPRWGSENLSWDDFLTRVKDANFDGIEYGIGSDTTRNEIGDVWSKASSMNLHVIAQHYSTYEADIIKHNEIYEQWLDRIVEYKPYLINSQTGKDFFSFEQNEYLINLANSKASRANIPLAHEMHRNKFSFSAHTTVPFLKHIPDLRLTFDISHWVCVSESYLADQTEAVDLAIERTDHLHARVGYTEGPQVPDPRISAWKESLDIHLAWWDRIIALKEQKKSSVFTITPEFGPYPYMNYAIDSNQPVASQWDINLFMMNLLKSRYG